MPAPRLSAAEQDRIDAGRCACGCNRPIELVSGWLGNGKTGKVPKNGNIYHEDACRKRAWRQRRKAGRVLTREDRARLKLREQAAALRALAEDADRRAEAARAEAARLRRQAGELEAEADGQTKLPGLAAPARDTTSSPAAGVSRPPYSMPAGEARDLARLGWSRELRAELVPAFRRVVLEQRIACPAELGRLQRADNGITGIVVPSPATRSSADHGAATMIHACPDCDARPGLPCVGTAPGQVHGSRLRELDRGREASRITGRPNHGGRGGARAELARREAANARAAAAEALEASSSRRH